VKTDFVTKYKNNISNKILVPTVVNKKDTQDFIFDTGYTTTIDEINANTLYKKNIVKRKYQHSKNSTNISEIQFYLKNSTFSFEENTFSKPFTTNTKLGDNLKNCVGVKGIIGSDIFKHGILYLNPAKKEVGLLYKDFNNYITQNDTFIKEKISLKPIQKNPFISITINNFTSNALLDYGSSLEMLIMYNPKKHQNEIDSLLKTFPTEKIETIVSLKSLVNNSEGIGINNDDTSFLYKIQLDSIKIGNTSFKGNYRLTIVTAKTKNIRTNFGIEMFNNFISYIDYKNKFLYLKKIEKTELNSINFNILIDSKSKKITSINKKYFTEKNCFQINDEVLKINGIDYFSEMNKLEVCERSKYMSSLYKKLNSIDYINKAGENKVYLFKH
jgi:hypothetical protein